MQEKGCKRRENMVQSGQREQKKEVFTYDTTGKKKNRDKEGLFIAEGLRFIREIPKNWEVLAYAVSNEKPLLIAIFLYF